MSIYIGTSGYSYKDWADGVFYPNGLPKRKWLEYYVKYFNTVELNVTFYRLPKKATFQNWSQRTPEDFVFAAKGSRYTTHLKKLKDPKDSSIKFFERAEGLKDKLGVVLWQLPGNFKFNKEKFTDFCKALEKMELAKNIRHVFEFRHESWFCDEIYNKLKKYNYALCIAHSSKWPFVEKMTADFLYIRFHGRKLYKSKYDIDELEKWADKIKKWAEGNKDTYVYFNNDANGYAIENALELKNLIKE